MREASKDAHSCVFGHLAALSSCCASGDISWWMPFLQKRRYDSNPLRRCFAFPEKLAGARYPGAIWRCRLEVRAPGASTTWKRCPKKGRERRDEHSGT